MDLLYKELQPYDHIIFDWNGTLLSDVECVWNIINETLDTHKKPSITYEDFRNTFCFPIKDFYKTLGVGVEHFHSFQHIFHTLYEERYKDLELYTGTLELIDELNSKGKKISVLSAAEQNHLHEAVGHFDVLPRVEHVYGLRDRGAEGKAERGHELLSEVSIAKERTIIVGDTLYDADVGKALNIDVLLIADGHQSYERLAKAHCKILPSRYRI